VRFEEFLPILGGLALGIFARAISKRIPVWMAAFGAFALALCATIVSGEFRLSWGFLMVDLLLVSAAAAAGYMTLATLQKSASRKSLGS